MTDRVPSKLRHGVGGVGGWLLPNFLSTLDKVSAQKLRERVGAELKTTFASRYTEEISLIEALRTDIIAHIIGVLRARNI